jgi:hypothetical protein
MGRALPTHHLARKRPSGFEGSRSKTRLHAAPSLAGLLVLAGRPGHRSQRSGSAKARQRAPDTRTRVRCYFGSLDRETGRTGFPGRGGGGRGGRPHKPRSPFCRPCHAPLGYFSAAASRFGSRTGSCAKALSLLRGTERSNPSPPAGETCRPGAADTAGGDLGEQRHTTSLKKTGLSP